MQELDRSSQDTVNLDKFFSVAQDLFCIADTQGYFIKLNNEWHKTLGYQLSELEGRRFLDFVHPDDLEATLQAVQHLSSGQTVLDFVNRYRCRDGSYRYIEWRSVLNGKDQIYAAARDVTERIRMDKELKVSREKLMESQRVSRVGSYELNVLTGVWASTEVMDEIFGIGPDYPKTVKDWATIIHPDDRDDMMSYFVEEVVGKRQPFNKEYRIMRINDHAVRWVMGKGQLKLDSEGLPVSMTGTIQDITERKLTELALAESLSQKVSLLRELQHRIKNSLSMITGLIGLEASRSSSPELKTRLEGLKNRVGSISGLYDLLSRTDEIQQVQLGRYLRELSEKLMRSYSAVNGDVELSLDLADVMMPVRQSVSVGLILNELMTNSFKYAFQDNHKGHIKLMIRMTAAGIELGYTDSGPGFQLQVEHTNGMGLELIKMMLEQLSAEMTTQNLPGYHFGIVIPFEV